MSNQREEEILRRRERIKKSKERRRRNQSRKTGEKKSRRKLIAAGVSIALITAAGGAGYTVVMGNAQKKAEVWSYEKEHYGENVLLSEGLAATNLCVSADDKNEISYDGSTDVHAAGLFDVDGASVRYSNRIHDRLYPASTTKILTALIALERGNLSDVVTVGKNADVSSFPVDASLCGLHEGDQLTLETLLYGLLLSSGNDAATAIAEYISGSEEAFVEEMNDRAKELMAVNTHFYESTRTSR